MRVGRLISCFCGSLLSIAVVLSNAAVSAGEEAPGGYASAVNPLEIAPLPEVSEVSIEEEAAVEFEGALDSEKEQEIFSFTSKRSGAYNFSISTKDSDQSVYMYIQDPSGEELAATSGSSHTENKTVLLDVEKTYTILVKKEDGGAAEFKVTVLSQKPVADISDNRIVKDQIVFSKQCNYYTYTPETSGSHSLILLPSSSSLFGVYVWDEKKELVFQRENDFGILPVEISLEAGKAYMISITTALYPYEELGAYSFQVGPAKPRVDISGYTSVQDKFDYKGQKNTYSFTAPCDGTYEITCDPEYKYLYHMYTEDEHEMILQCTNLAEESNTVCNLEEGKQYYLEINQSDDMGDYKINISYPENAQSYLDEFARSGRAAYIAQLESENEALMQENELIRKQNQRLLDIIDQFGIVVQEELLDETGEVTK